VSKPHGAARPHGRHAVTGRLCILLVLLDVITRVRVPVLPGWVVPLPVLLVAALAVLCATVAAWLVLHTPRTWPAPAPPEPTGARS
jgi:hypothetical protein